MMPAPVPQVTLLLMAGLCEALPHWRSQESVLSARWSVWLAGDAAEHLEANGGKLVKAVGDGLLACFEPEGQALTAAQGLLASWPGLIDGAPGLRVALHLGEVLRTPEDVYGSGVNLTSRLCELAGPGELWLSDAVARGLSDAQRARLQDRGWCYVKHWPVPIRGLQWPVG